MPAGPVDDVDEIADEALVKNSVVKIAQNTGSKESKGNVHQLLLKSTEKEKPKDHYQGDN